MLKKSTIILLLLLLAGIPVLGDAVKGEWKLKKSKAGIEVFVRDVAGSKLKEFKGVMTLSGTRLQALVAAFDDTSTYTMWMHECIEARLLKKISLRERISYTVTHAPWPVSDRDLVTRSVVSQDLKTLAVTIQMTGLGDYMPKVAKRVRVPMMNGLWVFKPLETGDIVVMYQLHSDPGGDLPAGLANMASVDLPYYTLLKLRDFIKQPKYANAVYTDVVEPKPVKK
jgi:hypothetical protein